MFVNAEAFTNVWPFLFLQRKLRPRRIVHKKAIQIPAFIMCIFQSFVCLSKYYTHKYIITAKANIKP